MTELETADPAPESNRSAVIGMLRLLGLFVVFLVLPMLLIAAMNPAQGCGGG